ARVVRARPGPALLPDAVARRSNPQALRGALPGQVEPGAFLLGCLRSRTHPVLRPEGAREGRERVVGPPGGELPRGDQSRILVRKRRGDGTRVLRVRAPRAS